MTSIHQDYLTEFLLGGTTLTYVEWLKEQANKYQEELDKETEKNNSVNLWVENEPCPTEVPIKELHEKYVNWCKERHIIPLSVVSFGRIIHTKLGLSSKVKKINGKSTRVFVNSL